MASKTPSELLNHTNDIRLSVTISEACEMTGLSRSSIYRLMDIGALQSRRILGRRVVLMASIRELVENGVAK